VWVIEILHGDLGCTRRYQSSAEANSPPHDFILEEVNLVWKAWPEHEL
jgi:hypothetical protein